MSKDRQRRRPKLIQSIKVEVAADWVWKRFKAAGKTVALDHRQPYLHRMTNWQRNQWARAGRPKDTASLESFTKLVRPLRRAAHDAGAAA